jgi:hypothetical protein
MSISARVWGRRGRGPRGLMVDWLNRLNQDLRVRCVRVVVTIQLRV